MIRLEGSSIQDLVGVDGVQIHAQELAMTQRSVLGRWELVGCSPDEGLVEVLDSERKPPWKVCSRC